MPFVTPGHRKVPDETIPGDLCYQYYKWMIDKWRVERRWTTAHNIYKEVLHIRTTGQSMDRAAALDLAWQVFFVMEVIPYEEEQMEKNGAI